MTTKICKRCGKDLLLCEHFFFKSKNSKDGYTPNCRACTKERDAETKRKRLCGEASTKTETKKAYPIIHAEAIKRAPAKKVLVPQSTANTHGLIPIEVPHGSNVKCITKTEKDTKRVFQKAKKIVESNDEPTIINSDRVFVVPKREDYHGSFDWDQVYGKKCSICHQKYKEEDRYLVIGMHLDTIITRHEVCGGE